MVTRIRNAQARKDWRDIIDSTALLPTKKRKTYPFLSTTFFDRRRIERFRFQILFVIVFVLGLFQSDLLQKKYIKNTGCDDYCYCYQYLCAYIHLYIISYKHNVLHILHICTYILHYVFIYLYMQFYTKYLYTRIYVCNAI